MKGVKMRKNKHYSKEFKESTIQLVLNSNEPVRKIAEDLDIKYNTLYDWMRDYKRSNGEYIESEKKSITKESIEEENKRLRKENRILKEERDILKKATAYFAKETL
jgi:transposase